jgi:hypothetical protein
MVGKEGATLMQSSFHLINSFLPQFIGNPLNPSVPGGKIGVVAKALNAIIAKVNGRPKQTIIYNVLVMNPQHLLYVLWWQHPRGESQIPLYEFLKNTLKLSNLKYPY